MTKREKADIQAREDSKSMSGISTYFCIDDEKLNKVSGLDHFFKSLMFQAIFDKEFDRDERDVLLVIFRKTIHFNKQWDRISIRELSQKAGPCESKVRDAIKRLESKAFIDIKVSKGGRTESRKRFNAYRISMYLFNDVLKKYNSSKRDHDLLDK